VGRPVRLSIEVRLSQHSMHFQDIREWGHGVMRVQRMSSTPCTTNGPDAVGTACASSSDGDGIPDGYELNNGLDPNDDTGDNGAGGDLDMDGVTNIDEYNDGTGANNPDSDNDGLGGAIDAMPLNASNDCIDNSMGPAGAKEFNDTAVSGMTTQCGSESQITVRGTAILEMLDARLELFAPNVIFNINFNVTLGTELRVGNGDSTPP